MDSFIKFMDSLPDFVKMIILMFMAGIFAIFITLMGC